jgi:hypothetical protein
VAVFEGAKVPVEHLVHSPLTSAQLLAGVPHVTTDDVMVTQTIGEGAFGEVSRAEVFPYGTVAIKWLKVGSGLTG